VEGRKTKNFEVDRGLYCPKVERTHNPSNKLLKAKESDELSQALSFHE
jgi:hypothetical protein